MLGKRESGLCVRSYSLRVRKSAVCMCCALYKKSVKIVSSKTYVEKDDNTKKAEVQSRHVGCNGVQLSDDARCIGEVSPVKQLSDGKKTVQMVSFEPKGHGRKSMGEW